VVLAPVIHAVCHAANLFFEGRRAAVELLLRPGLPF
jgi:hypothetical protein